MKLAPINKEHIIEAGNIIDNNGIPVNLIHNLYWVKLPNQKEYPFKHLVRTAYKLTEGNEKIKLAFQSNETYRNYVKTLGFPIVYYKEQLSFFCKEEITHYQSIARKSYRKANMQNIRDGAILKTLVRKLNTWADNSLIEDFYVKKDNHWQWSGTYKAYLWLRIFRKGDSKKVYFIVGVSGTGKLYMELNCQRSNHTGGSTKALPPQKIKLFDNYLSSSEYTPRLIDKSLLSSYNWDKLVSITQDFIYQYAPLYDELEKIAISDHQIKDEKIEKYVLDETTPPEKINSKLNKKRNFTGRKTDWSKKHATSKKLGNKGEELVILHEQAKLRKLGLEKKADLVHKKLDGEGYDILSFDENEKEMQIEVKTTTGNLDEPFYMSINEVDYYKSFPDNYYLYRLYSFNYTTKKAKFYKLSAVELDKLTFKSTNFEVSITN